MSRRERAVPVTPKPCVFNKEYLTAMEHGMPPITGFGMGIERIVALITGATNLKEAVMFPLLAPDDSMFSDLEYG